MPERPHPSSSAAIPDSTFVLAVQATAAEIELVRGMLHERIELEWDLIEDLRALGRPYDDCVKRAGLAMRVLTRLDMTKGPSRGPSENI